MENLVKIQNELKVPKGNFNSFGKYKYRSAEDILEAVKPLLLKYSCNLILTDEIILIGTKIFLQSTAKLKDSVTEEIAKGFAETSEHKGMSAEQTTGTASSYARKYALNGLFLIDETEQDSDSHNNKKEEDPKFVSTTHDKPWLNENTEDWKTVYEAVANHKCTIEYVESKFKLSKVIKDKLIKIQADGK